MEIGKQKLTCCCCGVETYGEQWYNRDTGYGLCGRCVDFVSKGQTAEEIKRAYGVEGVHYYKPTINEAAKGCTEAI